jgi:hypothetical protein
LPVVFDQNVLKSAMCINRSQCPCWKRTSIHKERMRLEWPSNPVPLMQELDIALCDPNYVPSINEVLMEGQGLSGTYAPPFQHVKICFGCKGICDISIQFFASHRF